MVENIISGIQVIGLYGGICPQAALEHLNLLKASITDDYIDCFDGEDVDTGAGKVLNAITKSAINLREKLSNAPESTDPTGEIKYALHMLDSLAPTQWSKDSTIKEELDFVLNKLEGCPDDHAHEFPELEAAKKYARTTLSSINYIVTDDNMVDICNILNVYSYALYECRSYASPAMLEHFWSAISPDKYYAESELRDQVMSIYNIASDVLKDIKSTKMYSIPGWYAAGISLTEEITKYTTRLAECPDYRPALRPMTEWCENTIDESIHVLNSLSQQGHVWAISLLDRALRCRRYLHQNIGTTRANHIALSLTDIFELCGAYNNINNGVGVKVG